MPAESVLPFALLCAAEAVDQPVARALHTVTYLAQRFMVVGGQTSLGPLGQLGMMCSPAVLHAQRLQQQALRQELQLVQAQQQRLELQAQCSSYQAQLEFDEAAGQVSCVVTHTSHELHCIEDQKDVAR